MISNRKPSRPYILSVLMLAISAAPVKSADEGRRPKPEQMAFVRDTCTNVTGIGLGIFPFDGCVESLAGMLSNQTQSLPKTMPVNPGKQKSYFESNADERLEKRQNSCARLGVVLGSPGFSDCVGRLNAALQYTIE